MSRIPIFTITSDPTPWSKRGCRTARSTAPSSCRTASRIREHSTLTGSTGSSSGAVAAFTVAWERPTHFRKVLSLIGTYVNLRGRGGHKYADIVRESPKKPLRVFLQDGRNDNRGRRRGGYDETWDWFHQNVRLAEALTEKGYDVNYVWGIGPHSSKHGGAIMPDMMRWLWRDHGVSTDVNDEVERSFNGPPSEAAESAARDD